MGLRGPRKGMTYRKRIIVPRQLVVRTDSELVRAQTFNERLDRFLSEIETPNRYPLDHLETEVVAQVVEAAQIMQHALIDGISAYEERKSPPARREEETTQSENSDPGDNPGDNPSDNREMTDDEIPYLPGSYQLGHKQSR